MDRRGWIGPLAPPRSFRQSAHDFGRVMAGVSARGGWWLVVACGVVPVLFAAPFGSSVHQTISAALGFALVVAAIDRRDDRRGILILPVLFAAHCACAIAVARLAPATSASSFPDGPEYWNHSFTWIRTGVDPEYDPANWLPEHAQLAGATVALGYLSLGLIPLFQGFHEVDLMNFYVGRLLAESHDSPIALLLGWHPWSVVRGVAYSVLLYEIVRWSYRRLTVPSIEPRERTLRLQVVAIGVGLLVLDGAMKLWLLDPVRKMLAAGLSGDFDA